MTKSVAIVVPHHRDTFKWNELISLNRCRQVFSKYDVILVYPKRLRKDNFLDLKLFTNYIPLSNRHFSSENAYNRLLLKPSFYRRFLDYDFILIYQLDTFVFEDNLSRWCESGYDYIGAPWPADSGWLINYQKRFPFLKRFMRRVGNGGFSLRRVKKFYLLSLLIYPVGLLWRGKWHEDIFWSWVVSALFRNFSIPDPEIALQFSFEQDPETCFALNNQQLPFGCHAWEKFGFQFWSHQMLKYGVNVLDNNSELTK